MVKSDGKIAHRAPQGPYPLLQSASRHGWNRARWIRPQSMDGERATTMSMFITIVIEERSHRVLWSLWSVSTARDEADARLEATWVQAGALLRLASHGIWSMGREVQRISSPERCQLLEALSKAAGTSGGGWEGATSASGKVGFGRCQTRSTAKARFWRPAYVTMIRDQERMPILSLATPWRRVEIRMLASLPQTGAVHHATWCTVHRLLPPPRVIDGRRVQYAFSPHGTHRHPQAPTPWVVPVWRPIHSVAAATTGMTPRPTCKTEGSRSCDLASQCACCTRKCVSACRQSTTVTDGEGCVALVPYPALEGKLDRDASPDQ
jgi:hypothetical protein